MILRGYPRPAQGWRALAVPALPPVLAVAPARAGYTYQYQFGSLGTGNGQFDGPEGVAVDGSGNVYVSDYYNSRVEAFNSSGGFVTAFGSLGSGDGQLHGPYGLAVDGSGRVFVADAGNNRIEVFARTVPEPSSLVLLGLGGVIAAGFAYRSARARRVG